MKQLILILGLTASLGAVPAHAAGCMKGATAGAIAGHFAGHHGVLGAAVGCGVGHHLAKKHAREEAARAHDRRERPVWPLKRHEDKNQTTPI